jgi:mono/diheme cytochrome c family protein
MHRFVFVAAAFSLFSLAAVAQTPPPASDATDAGAKLPPGEGRDVTMRVCTKCHDPSIAAEQNFDEKGWKDLVDQMASNGAKGTDEEFATIVAYLTKAFPAK